MSKRGNICAPCSSCELPYESCVCQMNLNSHTKQLFIAMVKETQKYMTPGRAYLTQITIKEMLVSPFRFLTLGYLNSVKYLEIDEIQNCPATHRLLMIAKSVHFGMQYAAQLLFRSKIDVRQLIPMEAESIVNNIMEHISTDPTSLLWNSYDYDRVNCEYVRSLLTPETLERLDTVMEWAQEEVEEYLGPYKLNINLPETTSYKKEAFRASFYVYLLLKGQFTSEYHKAFLLDWLKDMHENQFDYLRDIRVKLAVKQLVLLYS